MTLAGLPVPTDAVDELADLVRDAGADDLADRLERALGRRGEVVRIDERAVVLNTLGDPPDGLTELRAVLINEHQWLQSEGLDQ